MPLSDAERQLIATAATTQDPTRRRQAVAMVTRKEHGPDGAEAKALLGQSFLDVTAPSFHLVPKGDAMTPQGEFEAAYNTLAAATANFTNMDNELLLRVLLETPAAMESLRVIAGLTRSELSVAMKLVDGAVVYGDGSIKDFERKAIPAGAPKPRRVAMATLAIRAVKAVLAREILTVPPDAQHNFHSKVDRPDTADGWTSVSNAASNGVPYWALLYQRYVGGQWRQVQDAYSEVKGDNVLEIPVETLLRENGVPYYRAPSGASGAVEMSRRYNLNPGPDFVVPDEEPAVIIESKVCEDGGTVRDKASRIKNLALAGHSAGLVVCAVVDGKGWSERAAALAEVVIATEGRTYTLATINQLLAVPEIASVMNTRNYNETVVRPEGEEPTAD